jgi:hypothetical protein
MSRYIGLMVLAVLLACGCGKPEVSRTFEASPGDDAAVIMAALRAFIADPEVRTFRHG